VKIVDDAKQSQRIRSYLTFNEQDFGPLIFYYELCISVHNSYCRNRQRTGNKCPRYTR